MHLRRMCIQVHSDVKFYKYLWNPSGPVYHLKLLFLWRCCLEYLLIVESAVFKSPSISVLLSKYVLSLVINWLIYLAAPTFGAYILRIVMSSCWIDPFSMISCPSSFLTTVLGIKLYLSDIRMVPQVFWGLFEW